MNHVFAQPVGWDREDERRPAFAPVLAYILGIVGAAAVTGFALSAGGLLVRDASIAAAVAIATVAIVAGILAEARGRVAPLPERRRQVPRQWLAWRARWATAAAFGVMLGMCVWTLLHHAAIYVVAGCLLLVSPAIGAVVGIAYGLTRGGLLLATWLAIGSQRELHHRLMFLTMPRANLVLTVLATVTAACVLAVNISGS